MTEVRDSPWPRLVVGLTILSAGVVFWLDRIGRVEARDYLRWWPVALIVMGAAYLPQKRWGSAMAWLLVGIYFLLPLAGWGAYDLWQLIGVYPLLISIAGVTLMSQALRSAATPRDFRAVAVWSGNVRKIGSHHFSGGEAVAVMGGCDIDLSAARLSGEAVIEVMAFWGGIDIIVPHGWKVVGRVAEILGGYEDKTAAAPDSAPRLVIRGSVIMGGIEVRNAEPAG